MLFVFISWAPFHGGEEKGHALASCLCFWTFGLYSIYTLYILYTLFNSLDSHGFLKKYLVSFWLSTSHTKVPSCLFFLHKCKTFIVKHKATVFTFCTYIKTWPYLLMLVDAFLCIFNLTHPLCYLSDWIGAIFLLLADDFRIGNMRCHLVNSWSEKHLHADATGSAHCRLQTFFHKGHHTF